MIVRYALAKDEAGFLDLARIANAESTPHHVFDAERLGRVFRESLQTANPTIFVVEQHDALIGFQVAYVNEYIHTDGFFTVPQTTFVLPAKRGSRAAFLLMAHFIRWSDKLGAKECVGGNSNGYHSTQTEKFLQRFGYRTVGFCMLRRA